jgi:Sulfatase-modifying factor enzyme 1
MLGTVVVALAAASSASAASVHVTYLVECASFLQAGPRLQRAVTLELFATHTCDAPALLQQYVSVEAVPTERRIHERQPPTLALEADVAVETPSPELYLRLTGPGVKPLGGACQHVTDGAHADLALARRCPRDAVPSNGLCVDRYEASVWQIPVTRVDLVCKVIAGTAVPSDLRAPGVRQIGFPGPPFGHATAPGTFLAEGSYTTPLYAASLPGVLPSTYVSAYQAWAACGFSGKRLPTSSEWTAAAAGTSHGGDDADDCNTGAGAIAAGTAVKTGSRSRCISRVGAFDMVGNVSEWTMDGHSRTQYRGGAWDAGDGYGIAFTQPDVPLTQDNAVGFRCVR